MVCLSFCKSIPATAPVKMELSTPRDMCHRYLVLLIFRNTKNTFQTPGVQIWQDPVIMTKQLREDLNGLVVAMNDQIKKAVGADEKVTIVDYDEYFGAVGGRFCTKDVNKPEDDRLGDVTFFPLNLEDPFGTSPMKRNEPTQGYVWPGTFEGDLNYMAYIGGKNITYKPHIKRSLIEDMILHLGYEEIKDTTPEVSVLPDGVGRIFHPTVLGHSIITGNVLWHMEANYNKALGGDLGNADRFMSDQCPLIPDPVCFNAASTLPAEIFLAGSKDRDGAFHDFCNEFDSGRMDKQNNQVWRVRPNGDPIEILRKLKLATAEGQDSPPLVVRDDADEFNHEITLKWVPNRSSRSCTMDCKNAFKTIATGFCSKHGESGQDLVVKASQDISCGELSFEIREGQEELGPAECGWSFKYGRGVHSYEWGAPRGADEINIGKIYPLLSSHRFY